MTLAEMKLALRISTNALDSQITSEIASAQAELVRAGMSSAAITSEAALVDRAIEAYVRSLHAADLKEREGYYESFKYQADQLRKSYPAEEE